MVDLRVTVDPPPQPGPEELALAWNALLRLGTPASSSTPSAVAAKADDDVLIDLVVFARPETILPHASEAELWLTESSEALYPGLKAALIGKKPGDRVSVAISFPPEHPIPALRARSVGCVVDVLDVAPRHMPNDRAALCEARLGEPLEAVDQHLSDELLVGWADEVEQMIEVAVLDALCQRAPLTPDVEEWMIGAELSARFEMSEGALLRAKGVPETTITTHRSAWIQDPELQAAAHQAVRRALVVRAVIEAFQLELDANDLGHFIRDQADADGVLPIDLAHEIDEAIPEERDSLAQRLLERKAVEMLVSRAHLVVVSPPMNHR